ncbi:cutinase family protein [Nocardioides sp. SYSU DS0663]|uniref:RCC1 domain-containing protein n=1 Tax=Nocardioides sp. SYSU DS0663 TaxID=3416445 RepID=UPI003F4C2E17
MRRQGSQALLLIAAAVVSVAVVAALLHTGSARSDRQERDRAVLGAATAVAVESCADLLVLGVDGAGETPRSGQTFGRTVQATARALTRVAREAGRTVEAVRVPMASRPVTALVAPRARRDRALRAVTRARAGAWMRPVPAATDALLSLLDRRAVDCPDQQVGLVGHAQGAAAVHRALDVLAERPDGLARVAGAALVSDPDRRAGTSATALGAPPAARGRSGIATRLLAAGPDVPAPTPTYAVWSVCTDGDLVCDPRNTPVRAAVRTARSYASGPGAAAVRRAARALVARATSWPVPRPDVQVATATLGQPFRLQLEVSVDPAAGPGVVWEDPQHVPAGLVLDADGLLAGTPEQAGTWNISYRVRGTTPATTATTGVVVLTVPAGPAAVTAGGQVSCAVRDDGTAWCWGRNSHGQLGDGTTTTRLTPVEVAGDDRWRTLSTSGSTTCGIRTEGSLWCWGLDNFGQLGIGKGRPRTTPVQVGADTTWTSVSTSWFHTCGTRQNGTLWCWGQNLRGQLGDGTYRHRGRPTRVGTGRDWATVTTGGYFTCGTKLDGTAWCWGQNTFGQLGNARPEPQPVPQPVPQPGATPGPAQQWARLDAGWGHTCGVSVAGAALCWGLNADGQLGSARRAPRRTPEPVAGQQIWTSISTGDATTCGVDNAGQAWCWGSGRYGQVGDGTRGDRTVPVPVGGGHAWLSLDTGWFHACGGTARGGTACWGNNEVGQVGDGSSTDRPVPEEVS